MRLQLLQYLKDCFSHILHVVVYRYGVIIAILFSVLIAKGQCPDDHIIPDSYLIKMNDDESRFSKKTSASISSLLTRGGASIHPLLSRPTVVKGFAKLQVKGSGKWIRVQALPSTIDSLRHHPQLLHVEPNCRYHTTAQPNDPLFNQQWGHQLIQSPYGWDKSIGSQEVIVAVSDSGVAYDHPDLQQNMWVNQAELNGLSNVDDDNNGCVDDVYGCDFADQDGDPYPGSTNIAGHGTHVAGIIGAVGNNSTGVAGVNWQVRIMAAKAFPDQQETAALSDLVESIYYSVNNGATVINCSWGLQTNTSPQSLVEAIQYAQQNGVIVVAAAGNSAQDIAGFSPAHIDGVIAVGAVNSNNELSTFSNYGSGIDFVAPGGDVAQYGHSSEGVLSTYPNNTYEELPGTSMSSPFVAGLIALTQSLDPTITATEVVQLLQSSADWKTYTVPKNNLTFYLPLINVKKTMTLLSQRLPPEEGSEVAPPCVGENCSLSGTNRQLASTSLSQGLTNMGGCGTFQSQSPEDTASPPFQIFTFALLLLPISSVFLKVKVRTHL